jgi:hypothetical protein
MPTPFDRIRVPCFFDSSIPRVYPIQTSASPRRSCTLTIKELPRDKQREIQNVVDALIAKAS